MANPFVDEREYMGNISEMVERLRKTVVELDLAVTEVELTVKRIQKHLGLVD